MNALTGGWVSRTYDWNADAFGPLFEAEILSPILEIPEENAASGNGAGADGGASDNGASADGGASDSGASAKDGGASDNPDTDSSLYGGEGLQYAPSDDGDDAEPPESLARIGEDGKVYPFDPEDEAFPPKPPYDGDPPESLARIGEDGAVYPFDPEDEALQAQEGQEATEEQDPADALKQAGEALMEVLRALFGFSDGEEVITP